MKALLIYPGASWSTADVCAGLEHGLRHHGVDLVLYRLDQRIDRSNRWLYSNWRRTKKHNPAIEKPTTGDVFYQAGIGALEMALRHQVDVVLVVSAMFLHPDVIILMKRAGLRVVVLFTESPYDHDKEVSVAKLVDGCWTNERTVVDAFRSVNPNTGYLPHGWHSERHHAGPQPGDQAFPAHVVVFVGSGFPERVKWLMEIDWTGIDFGLYGSWEMVTPRHPLRQFLKGGVVDNVQAAALYRRAKIGLNLYRTSKGWGRNAPQIEHAESLNPRAYELARCGAFHLSTARAEVAEVFGDLVPTFATAAEASALIRRWLADDEGRARVQAALPGAVAEASWVHRSKTVVGDLQQLLGATAA
jgi:spore maturation protein CgeB